MFYNSANKIKLEDEKDFNPQRIPLLSGNIASNLFISQPPNQSIVYNPMMFTQGSRYQQTHQQAMNSNSQGRTLNDFLLQFISLCAQFGFQCPVDIASATINFLMHSLQQQIKNGISQTSMFNIHDSPAIQGGDSNNQHDNCVVMVSNLHEEKITPDALFTLFGVYGDVNRVKIMFNKKDTALVQFATPEQALLAINYFGGEKLFSKVMFTTLSKSGVVQLPKSGSFGDLTRDYTGSKLHRFRKPHSKNFHNIFPPNNVLHLSNIPDVIDENSILFFFQENDFRVRKVKFMQKDKKMALVELEDTDTAMQALIKLHNAKISENSHLRISFSKAGI